MTQSPRNTFDAALRTLLTERLDACATDAGVAAAAVERLNSLRQRLIPLVGREGHIALLTRAVALARNHYGCLTSVEVHPDGTLCGLHDVLAGQDVATQAAACVEVIAQLIGLLVTFVGASITRKLVGDIWPEPAAESGLGAEGTEG